MADPILVLHVEGATLPESLREKGWDVRAVSADALARTIEEATATRILLVVPPEQAEAAAAALGGPEAATEGAPEALPGRVSLSEIPAEDAPKAEPEEPTPVGWRAGLKELKATLDPDRWPAMPDALTRLAPVREVLERAGQRGQVTDESGNRWLACGWPDLLRGSSKVLLVRELDGCLEVIALHRHPRRVGIPAPHGGESYLPGADWDPDPIAVERTGKKPPKPGMLFAVDGAAVYTSREGRIHGWDGAREEDMGTPSQAMASLVLRWSQR